MLLEGGVNHDLNRRYHERAGAGLYLRIGRFGAVSQLPDIEHRRYDHRRRVHPGLRRVRYHRRGGTPFAGASRRHARGRLRRVHHGLFADEAENPLHSGRYHHQHRAVYRESGGDGLFLQRQYGEGRYDVLSGEALPWKLLQTDPRGGADRRRRDIADAVPENPAGAFHPRYRG